MKLKVYLISVINKIDINANNYDSNYLLENFNIRLNSEGGLLGLGNNCILYLYGDEFYEFISSSDPLTELRNSQFNNSLVKLSNDEWKI